MTNQEKEKQCIFDRYLVNHETSFESHERISMINFHNSFDVFLFFISADLLSDDVKIISEIVSVSNCTAEIETEFSREEIYHCQSK